MTKIERQEQLVRGYAFDCRCKGCLDDYPTLASGKLPASIHPNVALKLGNMLSKYKSLFEEGKVKKALGICEEYLDKLEALEVKYPHRNYEIATIALCSCLWRMVQDA